MMAGLTEKVEARPMTGCLAYYDENGRLTARVCYSSDSNFYNALVLDTSNGQERYRFSDHGTRMGYTATYNAANNLSRRCYETKFGELECNQFE